jgi:hypothetical protein
MATPTGTFRPAQALMTGSATALQLRMFLGRLIGIYLRGMQIGNKFMRQEIQEGLSWQCPAYGLVEDGKYHVAGESVIIDSGYLQQVPFADKTFFIDLPWVNNILTPSFDTLQTHYSVESIRASQLAERQARHSDLKACRRLANSAEDIGESGARTANVTGGSVPAGSVTPGGLVVTNAAMLTSATVILDSLRQAAQRFDENDIPDGERYFACHPAQYHLLVADRQLLDGDVQAVRGSNGDYPTAKVYMAHGFTLLKSTALKAMRTAGTYTNITGDNNLYTEFTTGASGTFTQNAGICFTNESCIRLVRKEFEMNSWYENERFAQVITTRVIDGYGTYRPETVVAFKTG